MDPREETAALTAFAGRRAGGEIERRAAVHLARRLEALGLVADVEPFRFPRRWALSQAAAAGAAVIGSVVSVGDPTVGAAIVAVAFALSTVEALGFPVLARLLGVRASQNVSCPVAPAAHATAPAADGRQRPLIVLAAAYDAPRSATLTRLAERLGDPAPWVAATFVAVLLCCLARLAGLEGAWLTAIQLVPTLTLLALVPALVELELAPLGDGAAEAAGSACALTLAERLRDSLDHLDVWIVLAGAGAANRAGMRAWQRRHQRALDARPTVTVEVGAPEPEAVAATVASFEELVHGLDETAGEHA